MRLTYPPPRSSSTGIKGGPCGDDDFTVGDITTLQPNSIVTLEIYESVYHRGAPLRVALSHVEEDYYDDCILLDHIPQHNFERTLNNYQMLILVKDVQ